jgi:hypothetical protein
MKDPEEDAGWQHSEASDRTHEAMLLDGPQERVIDLESGEGARFWECPACFALTLPQGQAGHQAWHAAQDPLST